MDSAKKTKVLALGNGHGAVLRRQRLHRRHRPAPRAAFWRSTSSGAASINDLRIARRVGPIACENSRGFLAMGVAFAALMFSASQAVPTCRTTTRPSRRALRVGPAVHGGGVRRSPGDIVKPPPMRTAARSRSASWPTRARSTRSTTPPTVGDWFSRFVYEALVTRAADGTIAPGLSDTWEFDGTVATFHIREGVTCTDGSDTDPERDREELRVGQGPGQRVGLHRTAPAQPRLHLRGR